MNTPRKFVARSVRRFLIGANNLILRAVKTPQKVVWIVGDGRSGTTWLAELINHNRNFRFMFEPFHPGYVKFTASVEPLKYLPPDVEDPEFQAVAARVFSGKLLNGRVDMFNKSLVYRDLLVKDIFANLYLAWVGVNFPDIRKILLLRHPCAVAESKIRHDEMAWVTEPDRLFDQPLLNERYLEPFEYLLDSVDSKFEKLLLIWSIIHYVALLEFDQETTHLVFYEDLCTNLDETIGDLLGQLDVSRMGEEKLRSLSSRGSKMASNRVIDKNSAVSGWQAVLTEGEKMKADRILGAFGLDAIYSADSPLPDVNAAIRFVAENKAK